VCLAFYNVTFDGQDKKLIYQFLFTVNFLSLALGAAAMGLLHNSEDPHSI